MTDDQEPAIGQSASAEPPVGTSASMTAPKEPPPPSVWSDLADDAKQAGAGALKATGRTAVNLLKVADWVFNGNHDQPFLDALKNKIGEPTGTAQKVGGLGADVATAFLPAGEIGKAGEAAETLAAKYGWPLLGKIAKVATNSAAGGATSAVQGQSPTAGAIGAGGVSTLGVAADSLAPMVKAGAVRSMIRALGPSGGRGPTGDANLKTAEQIAPELVDQGFGAVSHEAARAKAGQMVADAKTQLKTVLHWFGGAPEDQPSLLKAVQAQREKLLVDPGNGQPAYLPTEQQSVDKMWGAIEDDVKALGTDPTKRAVHELKSRWNDVVNFAQNDPQKGSQTAVYKTAGNLIRAQLSGSAPLISDADHDFHVASSLQSLLSKGNVRRPGPGVSAALMPLARPAAGAGLGGYIGYREGGAEGAVTGAISGAALGNLIQSPGFRFASATLKNQLAKALDRGDSAMVSQLFAVISAQANALGGKQ